MDIPLDHIKRTLRRPCFKAPVSTKDRKRVVLEAFPDARCIGQGIDRAAYRVGDFVIKGTSNWSPTKPPVEDFRRRGVSPPRQWVVNGWVVQPYYPRVPDSVYDALPAGLNCGGLDLHEGNLGFDAITKQVIAFDW